MRRPPVPDFVSFVDRGITQFVQDLLPLLNDERDPTLGIDEDQPDDPELAAQFKSLLRGVSG